MTGEPIFQPNRLLSQNNLMYNLVCFTVTWCLRYMSDTKQSNFVTVCEHRYAYNIRQELQYAHISDNMFTKYVPAMCNCAF